jgi:hypothetical protein
MRSGSLDATGGFEAAYLDADGVERSVKLEELSRIELETARPVRSVGSHPKWRVLRRSGDAGGEFSSDVARMIR